MTRRFLASISGAQANWVVDGVVEKPASPVTFTINGSAPAAGVTVPAALGAPSLVLLSDVITYAGTLQTRVDLLEGVVRKVLDILAGLGVVVEA